MSEDYEGYTPEQQRTVPQQLYEYTVQTLKDPQARRTFLERLARASLFAGVTKYAGEGFYKFYTGLSDRNEQTDSPSPKTYEIT